MIAGTMTKAILEDIERHPEERRLMVHDIELGALLDERLRRP